MRKSHTRERHVLGHVNGKVGTVKIATPERTAAPPPNDQPVSAVKVPAVEPAQAEANRAAFEAAVEQAHADALKRIERDDEILAGGVYAGTGADPGSIVGLDGFTPGGDTDRK